MEWISKFVFDQIHMTEGERLINYWYVWLAVLVALFCIGLYRCRKS